MNLLPRTILTIVFTTALIAFPLAARAASRDNRGFEGVAFGTPRAQAIEQLCTRLKIGKVQGFSGVDYRGPDGLRLIEEDEDIVLQGYHLDRLRTDVVLFFNVNGKFFRVQYEAQKRPAGYFETTINDDVVALSRTFQKIYGSPTFQMAPHLSEMRPGSRSYFWRWTRGRDTVYTAIIADENDFGAIAVLSDDSLLRETPEPRPEPSLPPLTAGTTVETAPSVDSFTTSVDTASVTAPVPMPTTEMPENISPAATPAATPAAEFVPAQEAPPAAVPSVP